MVNMFFESDINSEALNEICVAVIGYGSQGRAQALNLRDSGIHVVLGLRAAGKSWRAAVADGWIPLSIEAAAAQADIVCLLTPDMSQPKMYRDQLRSHMKPGSTLLFAHGFNIHYGAIQVPVENNVVLLAPKGVGKMVRRQYEEGSGVPGLVAVHQNATGNARDLALAYGWAIGSARTGIIETTFAEETETDLFGEQAVLCGGLTELIVAGWETLVEAGYQPEVAYFECLHEVKLVVDLIFEGGISRMFEFISDTAAYGDLVSGKRVVGPPSRAAMKEILQEIQDGTFAKNWQAEDAAGNPNFHAMRQADIEHPIEVTGKNLRDRFARLKKSAPGTSASR